MANMTFKANLLPNSTTLEYSLGSETQKWNIYGNLTGNASTATKLETARTLTVGSTGKSFDGSADVSWSHAEIGATVSNTWTDGTTAGPTIKTTVNGVAGTAVAIPSASESASGVITTGAQAFKGRKTFGYTTFQCKNDSGSAVRYADFFIVNAAGTAVGEYWYDCGNATNISSGRWGFREYSPNSTANTSTTGFYETYYYPTVTAGLTENKTYYLLTSKNYTDYTVTKTGSGASGTWGISISGNAATATKLANITLNSTTINNTAGSFAFSGSGEPWASTDWVGLQIGDGVDKFQIHALNGTHFEYRQNDSGGTNTSWGAWQTYVNRAGDTMSGDLTVSHSSTANSSFNAVNSNGSVGLLASTNRGVYDNTNSKWIIYLKVSDSTVRSNYPIYGAVWNDYAEYRETKDVIEPGRCIKEIGDGSLTLTTERLQAGCEIVSDTFGFAIGQSDKCQTPTAASGRVLVYCLEGQEEAKKHIGEPVCSGPNGTVSIMTHDEEKEWPSRVIGTISEIPTYDIWHAGNQNNEEKERIKVNGRIWIRIR